MTDGAGQWMLTNIRVTGVNQVTKKRQTDGRMQDKKLLGTLGVV